MPRHKRLPITSRQYKSFEILDEAICALLLKKLNIKLSDITLIDAEKIGNFKKTYQTNNENENNEAIIEFLQTIYDETEQLDKVVSILTQLAIACNYSELDTYTHLALYIISHFANAEVAEKAGEKVAAGLQPNQAAYFYVKLSENAMPHDREGVDVTNTFILALSLNILMTDADTHLTIQQSLYSHFCRATEIVIVDLVMQQLCSKSKPDQNENNYEVPTLRPTIDALVDDCCKPYVINLITQYVDIPNMPSGLIDNINAAFRYALQQYEINQTKYQNQPGFDISLPSTGAKISSHTLMLFNGILTVRKITGITQQFTKFFYKKIKLDDGNNEFINYLYEQQSHVQENLQASLIRLIDDPVFTSLFNRQEIIKFLHKNNIPVIDIHALKRSKNIFYDLGKLLDDSTRSTLISNLKKIFKSKEPPTALIGEPFFRLLILRIFASKKYCSDKKIIKKIGAILLTLFSSPGKLTISAFNKQSPPVDMSKYKIPDSDSFLINAPSAITEKIKSFVTQLEITPELLQSLQLETNHPLYKKILNYNNFSSLYVDLILGLAGFYGQSNDNNNNQALTIHKIETTNLTQKKQELAAINIVKIVSNFLMNYLINPNENNSKITRLTLFMVTESQTNAETIKKFLELLERFEPKYRKMIFNTRYKGGDNIIEFSYRASRSVHALLETYIKDNNITIIPKENNPPKITSYDELLFHITAPDVEMRTRSKSEGSTTQQSHETSTRDRSTTTIEHKC